MAEKKKAVSFTASELSEGKSKKQPPTQKYDRKEIQKRLDIENWMDEELKRIYAVEVNPLLLRAGYLSSLTYLNHCHLLTAVAMYFLCHGALYISLQFCSPGNTFTLLVG